MKSIDDFTQAHHNYKPHNTFWDTFARPQAGLPEDLNDLPNYRGESLFRCDVWEHHPGEYVRDPVIFEKDEWGRGKIYYEYGWGDSVGFTEEERQAQTLVSHCPRVGHETSKNYPIHPADIRFTLKIRHITDWSAKEQDDLDKFITKIINDHDLGFKEAPEYTDKQVADWMSAVDYAEHCRMLMTSKLNGQADERAWICRCCKRCYVAGPVGQGQDYGNNPEPLYKQGEMKVCDSCNHNFVMTARFGADKHDFIFPAGQFISPFWYPKPEGARMPSEMADGDDRGSFFTAIEGPREVRQLTPDELADLEQDARACDKALISKLQQLLEETRDRARNGGIGLTQEKFREEIAQAEERQRQACADKLEKAELHLADARNLMDVVAMEKQEIKQNAESCRKSLAKVKQMNAPQGQKIETLKKEVANRDELIAEQKKMLEFVGALPPKAKFRMVMEQLRQDKGQARLVLPDPEVGYDGDCPYLCRFSGYTRYPNEKYVEKWAVEDYRRVSDDIKKAEEKKKEQQMKSQRKKKQVEMLECAYCEKSCHKKSMVEKWGDMVCRQCAK